MPTRTRSNALAPLLASLALLSLACSGGTDGDTPAAPALRLSASTLAFTVAEGGPDPAPQTFTVSNGGGGELAAPSVVVDSGARQAWLLASVDGARAPFTVSLQPTVATLPVGTYTATVLVRSNGASNTPQSVAVSLAVVGSAPRPRIQLSSTSVTFDAQSYGPAPAPKGVTVTNAGQGTLARPTLTVTYDGGVGDWLAGSVAGEAAPYTVTLQPALAGLGAGTYHATVAVESSGAESGAAISVTLTLTPTWTVLVYGSGDGALSTSLASAIADMSQANLAPSVTVLVAADFSAGRPGPGGARLGPGTDWYRIRGGGAEPELLVHVAEEQDFGDPAVLTAAVSNAFYAFPADHRAVLLWGSGASWLGGFGGDEQDTPADPADDGAPLAPAQVAGAISDALAQLGLPAPIDVVAFDAPLMGGQEVAFAFADVARVFIGTAGMDLGPGWDWAATLGRLAANPSQSGAAFAAGEVQDWDARHAPASAAEALVRAHAALDLARMPAYADAWAALSDALVASGSTDWLAVARQQFGATPGYGLDDPTDPDLQPSLRDAGQLLDALASLPGDSPVGAAAAEARGALDGLVLASALGDARRAGGQVALHLEAPLGGRFPARAGAYGALAWDARTHWSDVLWSLAGNDDAAAPAFEHVPQNTGTPSYAEPPTVLVTSFDPDVAAARLTVARSDAAGVLSYGLVAGDRLDPGMPLPLVWDGNLPALGDGATSSWAYLQPWQQVASGAVFLVPGRIGDGTSAIDAYAVVAAGAPVVDAVAVRVGSMLAVLPLGDFRGLGFTPLVRDEATGAWKLATPLAIPDSDAAELSFAWTSAPAGTYRLTTRVTDVFGNVAHVADAVTVTSPFGR